MINKEKDRDDLKINEEKCVLKNFLFFIWWGVSKLYVGIDKFFMLS